MRKTTLLMLLLALCTLSFAQRPLQRHIKQLPKSPVTQVAQPAASINLDAKATSIAQRQARKSATTARRAPRKAEAVTPPTTAETVSYIIEGENYQYSSSAEDFVLQSSFSPANGAVVIDGSDIYIQGLAHWLPESWVKGTIDGATVTVPSFQYLGEDSYGAEYLVGNNLDGTEEKDIVFAYDAETGKLTLDENTRIEETDENKDQFGYWKNLSMAPGKIEKPDVVVVPDGLVGETWELAGQRYRSGSYSDASFDVTVYIDGSDIYIKGFDSQYLTDAAVKGTIADGKATFASPQYLGAYYGTYDMYFVGGNGEALPEQITFTYDEEAGKLTLDEGTLYIASTPEAKQYYYAIAEVTITKPAPEEPVVAPDDLVTKDYALSGKDLLAEGDLAGTVKVGISGTDVYVQGLIGNLPEAWVKGSLSGDEVTFPVQYVGTTTDGQKLYLAGYENGGLGDFVIYREAEADTYAADGVLFVNPNNKTFNYDDLLAAYTGVFFGQRPAATAAPADLETVSLPLAGKNYDGEKLSYDVKVGFAENEVYIQGIYADMPEAWIRGQFNEGKTEVSFPAGQCLGSDDAGWEIYLAGDAEDSEEPQPVVFTYSEKSNFFELQNNLYFNGRPNTFFLFDLIEAGATINSNPDAMWIAAEDKTLTDKGEVSTITIDAFTSAALAQKGGSNTPKYYESSLSVRLYAGNTMTFTSSKEIAKIVFYMDGKENQMNLETEEGDYTFEDKVGTWTGMAKSVSFDVPNVSGTQARIQRIDIYYVDYSTTLCEAPADLVTEDYKYLASTVDYYGDVQELVQDVKVGFYVDNYVYIQGLYSYLPEAWVRGEIVDGKLIIPDWFLGTYTFPFWGINVDYTFGGASLDYDAEKQMFTSEDGFSVVDGDGDTEDFTNVKIMKASDYTGISDVKANTAATAGRYYNINGMRVDAPSKKGIYIRDGRKFIVK